MQGLNTTCLSDQKGWFHFSIVTAHKFFVLPKKNTTPGKKNWSFPPHQPLEKKITALEKKLSTTTATTTTTTTATTYFFFQGSYFFFQCHPTKEFKPHPPWVAWKETREEGSLEQFLKKKYCSNDMSKPPKGAVSPRIGQPQPPDLFVCIRKVDGCIAHQGIQPMGKCRKCAKCSKQRESGWGHDGMFKERKVLTNCLTCQVPQLLSISDTKHKTHQEHAAVCSQIQMQHKIVLLAKFRSSATDKHSNLSIFQSSGKLFSFATFSAFQDVEI